MHIIIDLGGTNTRVAASKDLTKLDNVERFSTQNTLEKQQSQVIKAIHKVTNYNPETICIGAPGIIDQKNSKFGNIVNIPYLNNLEFYSIAEEYKDVNFICVNDAALAGLGEAVFGAGKDFETIAYITISTGVGGIRISGKKLDFTQPYSEPGHHIIDVGGQRDTKIHLHGTLDAYVSGQAFIKDYGTSAKDCENEDIWENYAQKLSHGLINVCAFWAPEAIIIGGGVSNNFDKFIDPLKKYFKIQDFFEMPQILKAELGDNSGLFGGMALIKQAKNE